MEEAQEMAGELEDVAACREGEARLELLRERRKPLRAFPALRQPTCRTGRTA